MAELESVISSPEFIKLWNPLCIKVRNLKGLKGGEIDYALTNLKTKIAGNYLDDRVVPGAKKSDDNDFIMYAVFHSTLHEFELIGVFNKKQYKTLYEYMCSLDPRKK